MMVVALDWGRSSESQEDCRLISLNFLDDNVYIEVLSNASYDWSKSLLQLPIEAIIKHVQKDNRLISNANITVTLQLNKEFLNPVKTYFVVCDLSNE